MRLQSGATVGYSLGYAYSSSDVKEEMGSGHGNSVQLSLYASQSFDSGYFVQGMVGAGLGRNRVARHVSLSGVGHHGSMNTRNIAASGLIGLAVGQPSDANFELTAGVRYMGHRYGGFSDGASDVFSALDVNGGTLQSLVASLGAAATVPFNAGSVDWRASAWATWGHEFADTHATLHARLLDISYQQRSGDIGRDRLMAGLSLSGQIGKQTTLNLGVSGELAKNWTAAGATLGLRVAF